MRFKDIENIRNRLYKHIDPKDSKLIKFAKSMLVAFSVSHNREEIEDYVNEPTHYKKKNFELMVDYINNPENHPPLYNLYLDMKLTTPEIFEEGLNISPTNLLDYFFEADIDDIYRQPHINANLSKLVLNLLDIKDNNTVANFGFNYGIFELNGLLINQNAHFISPLCNERILNNITELKSKSCKKTFELRPNFDLFKISNSLRFDRIFTFAPLGLQAKSLQNNDFMGKIYSEHPIYRKSNLAEWFYVLKTLHHLHKDGTAVVLLSNGATWNSLDNQIRRDLIRQKVIKAVISLPEKVIRGVSCPTTLLVLKRNSPTISMIDASNIFTSTRRLNVFEDYEINKILSLVDNNTTISKVATIEDMQKEDFTLNPIRYTNTSNFKNSVPLKDLLTAPITRGKSIKAVDLDIASTAKHKNYNYLTLSNICDGHIDENLTAIADINLNTDKYFVNNQDIVISKSGPFKTAIMDKSNILSKTIASDNMYILKLETAQINPYYLKAFFESEEGQKALKKVSSGTNTNILTKEQLENLQIPLISLAEQDKIANEYKQIEKEIISLKQKLEVLTIAQKSIWR